MFLNTPAIKRVKSGFEPLPNGVYRVLVTKSEGRDTAAGNGRFISMAFDVIEGQFKGRKVFNIFNTENPNADAVERGQSDLATLVEALGHPQPVKTEAEFHSLVRDRILRIKVGQRKDKKTGEMRNTVTDFYKDGDDELPKASASSSGLDDIPF